MAQNPAIAAFVAAQTEYQNSIDRSIDGLVTDIKKLNDTIERLQNTPPVLDPADQTLLDQVQAQGKAIAERVSTLDDQTPPDVPPNV